MSLFKKPNRNIRRREIEVQEDDFDTKETDTTKSTEKSSKHNSNLATKFIKQTLLSFGEELNEGDDGEIFQVKKSSQSRKLRRQIEREKEERKKKEPSKADENTGGKDKIISTDEVTIKIINPIAGPVVRSERVLTGLSAEMAGYKSESEEEEDRDGRPTRPKFTQPDQVKLLLKSGKIPDAALIHAARKRRQQAREMGTANFIPLEEEQQPSKAEIESKSRLIREDDNDCSDEEERISMSGIVSFAADREKRKEGLDAVILSDGDEDHYEDDEWEAQQIRKAVTGAQLAAVKQESMYMQMHYMSNAATATSNVSGLSPSLRPAFSSPNSAAIYDTSTTDSMNNAFSSLSTDNGSESLEPAVIVKKLRDRLEKSEEANRRHELDLRSMSDEMVELQMDFENRKVVVPELIKKFQFYQDLRGYVTDLVECLDEKLPIIVSLEERVIAMYQKKSTELMNRRRQDVKDQMEDVMTAKNITGVKQEERERRTAEREGRRIRRMKGRSLAETTSHVDGLSSDDEITEMASAAFRNQKDIIESDARRVFDDVVEEFISIDEILKRFYEWRKIDKTAYVEAYANMCLPKILGPIIRMNMLMWNPLKKAEDVYIEKFKWIEHVIVYSAEKSDTEESLRNDPDLQLVPKIIEKTVIPKLEQIVKAQWDPLSVTETRQLVAVTRKILEYPFIGPSSKLFNQLIDTVIEKINQAIENDVFIPVLPKQLVDAGKSNVFFQRQFAYSVKLFGNLLRWHGIINDDLLIEKANSSLLNRYLLMAIRILPPIEAANKSHMIAAYMPETWLKSRASSITNLSPFFMYVKQLINQIDYASQHGREAIEKLTEIVKYVRS